MIFSHVQETPVCSTLPLPSTPSSSSVTGLGDNHCLRRRRCNKVHSCTPLRRPCTQNKGQQGPLFWGRRRLSVGRVLRLTPETETTIWKVGKTLKWSFEKTNCYVKAMIRLIGEVQCLLFTPGLKLRLSFVGGEEERRRRRKETRDDSVKVYKKKIQKNIKEGKGWKKIMM